MTGPPALCAAFGGAMQRTPCARVCIVGGAVKGAVVRGRPQIHAEALLARFFDARTLSVHAELLGKPGKGNESVLGEPFVCLCESSKKLKDRAAMLPGVVERGVESFKTRHKGPRRGHATLWWGGARRWLLLGRGVRATGVTARAHGSCYIHVILSYASICSFASDIISAQAPHVAGFWREAL